VLKNSICGDKQACVMRRTAPKIENGKKQ